MSFTSFEGMGAWQANMDIQPVFNEYKAVACMCSYFSKSEDKCLFAMKQAAQEAFNAKLDQFNTMKITFRSGGYLSYFARAASEKGFSWSAVCKYKFTRRTFKSASD